MESEVPDHTLTPDQAVALGRMEAFLDDSCVDTFFRLTGFAGTGKTYLLRNLYSNLLNNMDVVATAPTNKATKVLASTLKEFYPVCKTIYSALGLVMQEDKDELVLTYPKRKDRPLLPGILIIDEGSQLHSDVLVWLQLLLRESAGTKVLILADKGQIPPVGEDTSPMYSIEVGEHQAQLSTVVRHDNQILRCATHIRSCIFDDTTILNLRYDHDRTGGVYKMVRGDFLDMVEYIASRGRFSQPDHSKVVAWRNRVVNTYNETIRAAIFGERSSTAWLEGDRIAFRAPVIQDKYNILATVDDEGVVETVDVDIDCATQCKCWILGVRLDGTDKTFSIKVLHWDSRERFVLKLERLAASARIKGRGFLWAKFWKLKNSFASVNYGYAITAHRAQGSTYINTFVDSKDILSNPDSDLALRCLYVACTRPSKRLIIC